MPRIALIHATALAIDPILEAFARLWPQARLTNLLEDDPNAYRRGTAIHRSTDPPRDPLL